MTSPCALDGLLSIASSTAHSECSSAGNGNDGHVVSGSAGAWGLGSTFNYANAKSIAKKTDRGDSLTSWGGIYLNGCMCSCDYIYNGSEVGGSQHCVACEPGWVKKKLGTAQKKCTKCSAGQYSKSCRCRNCPSDSITLSPTSMQVRCDEHKRVLRISDVSSFPYEPYF